MSDAKLLDYAATLERRVERGRHLDDAVSTWLLRMPVWWALWLEMLQHANDQGVVCVDNLKAWAWLDTKRKRRYFVRTLADFGVIEELEHGKVRLLA